MISTQTARDLINQAQNNEQSETLPIEQSLKRALFYDFVAPQPLPLFSASAMDGYAVSAQDTASASETKPIVLKIVENIPAGHAPLEIINSGYCARIMTGAILPPGADCVIMQEHVKREGDFIFINSPAAHGSHIRKMGEEFKTGDSVFQAHTVLTPSHAALLASFGVSHVSVFADPKIVIIPTGSELALPGQKLKPGQVYESSVLALRLALQEAGLSCRVLPPVADDPQLLKNVLKTEKQNATHILMCGGVSVGDADHNKAVLADLNFKTIFWKIAQKPGKPFYFGRNEKTQVFGLPGNPVSTLVCFYEYVLPALKLYRGWPDDKVRLKVASARLGESLQKPQGRTDFIRAQIVWEKDGYTAWPLKNQGSHRLSSLSEAQAWIVASADQEILPVGQTVEIHEF